MHYGYVGVREFKGHSRKGLGKGLRAPIGMNLLESDDYTVLTELRVMTEQFLPSFSLAPALSMWWLISEALFLRLIIHREMERAV